MQDYLKTFLLLGLLSVVVIFLGDLIGGQDGLMMAFLFSVVMNVGAYFFSDKLALSSSGAKPMAKSEHPEIYKMVEELTQKLKIPMPKLYKIPTEQANAFATGRDPSHASVAVTEGLMRALDKDEIKGVLSHELGHVKNRDILIATVAAVLASVIGVVARMGMYSGSSDEDRPAGGLGILLMLFAPLGAMLIQMAVSRNREFEADETGAETLGDGDPLARALVKIHQTTKAMPLHVNPAFSSLYIDNPLGGVGGALANLFSTHPPLEERVKRLQAL